MSFPKVFPGLRRRLGGALLRGGAGGVGLIDLVNNARVQVDCHFDVQAEQARVGDEMAWERTPEGQLHSVKQWTDSTDFRRLCVTKGDKVCVRYA